MYYTMSVSLLAAAAAIVPVWAAPSEVSLAKRDVITGKSTFYGGNLNGACGEAFGAMKVDVNTFHGTAYSGQVWDNGLGCGGCVTVTGPKGTITAMVVDKCPECDEGHLDLFQNVFAQIGNPSDGIIPTSYEFNKCPPDLVSGPLKIVMKQGSSQYWFAAFVVNGNRRVKNLEVSSDGGKTWQPTQRTDNNYFQISSGTGGSSVSVRVTSFVGSTVVVDNVSVSGGATTEATSNFD